MLSEELSCPGHSNVLQIIKKHHSLLTHSIKVIQNKGAVAADKQNQVGLFIRLFQSHSIAEEATLYSVLKDIEESQLPTFEGQEEHAVCKILIDELEKLNFRSQWSHEIEAKAIVLSEIVAHHISDEENDIFIHAQQLLTSEELLIIGEEYQRHFNSYFLKSSKPIRQSELTLLNTISTHY